MNIEREDSFQNTKEQAMPLNVVVICLDTLRADCIGPDKAVRQVATPNMDAFAR